MSTEAKVATYVEKLVAQYRTQPRARATIGLLVTAQIADDLATALARAFVVETAIGAQLDVIGKYVGVPRNIGTPVDQGYFGLWDYASARDPALYQGTWVPAADNPPIPAAAPGNAGFWYVASANGTSSTPIVEDFVAGDVIFSDGAVWAKETDDNGNGFTDYADNSINAAGRFYSYSFSGSLNTNLTDPQYRTVIKLKIATNVSDGTLSSIVAILHQFFPDQIFVTDNADMTMDYVVSFTVDLPLDVLAAYLPKPMGVGITVASDGILGLLLTEGGDFLTTEAGDFLAIT